MPPASTAFGVNLFVPGAPTADPDGLAAYVASLEPEAAALGWHWARPSWDDDDYAAQGRGGAGRATRGR